MAGNPPAYHSVYDNIPFDHHPEECPCIYHQVDGDALIRQANDADSGEWAYAYYNHPNQLTRESIIEYFEARGNWARKHAIWLEAFKAYTEGVSLRISCAKDSQEYCRRELEYRRQFVGLLSNESYDREWREWEMYIGKIDELYRKGGAMQRFQIEMRVMEGIYKEAGELYEFFWDLEDHRGPIEIDKGCKAILEKLRANLKQIKSLQSKIKESRYHTMAVFDNPPPPWAGGLTAPTYPTQRPEAGDLLLYL